MFLNDLGPEYEPLVMALMHTNETLNSDNVKSKLIEEAARRKFQTQDAEATLRTKGSFKKKPH